MSTQRIDSVRFSHAGHDFHFIWSARRALRILDPAGELSAIAIEGVSPFESGGGPPVEGGLLVIDTAEYYGGEAFEDASRINYCQLKYSTTSWDKPWTASKLTPSDRNGKYNGTIHGFAQRYSELKRKYGEKAVSKKVRFHIVTNRPMSKEVEECLALAREEKDKTAVSKKAHEAYIRFLKASGLRKAEFYAFSTLLVFSKEDSREAQSAELAKQAARFLPSLNTDITLRLKEMVRSKAMPDLSHDPMIRRETILRALDIPDPKRLLPSPPIFAPTVGYIPRKQEKEITEIVLKSKLPVVIHAHGGIGKSVFAQQLSKLMPTGSEVIVFDGFAGGGYRSPRDPRHRHDRGLVQIANELAFRGLCDPLLPRPDTDDNYLNAFYERLEQAASTVRTRGSDAVVLIILDAADNSEMAARDAQVRSFASNLLQETTRENCRVVAFARTERLSLLNLRSNVLKIELSPFSKEETAQHLRRYFSKANDGSVEEFHRLTGGNPRVQASALSVGGTLIDVLRRLGPLVRSVDDVIEEQLEASLQEVREHAASPSQVERLCIALAALPPLVPIRVLAAAAGVPESAIRSFVSDLGRPLLILDDAVQFRDEPVETWFRKRFSSAADDYTQLLDALSPLASQDIYIASSLPMLLYNAGRYEQLMELSLSDATPETNDPIEKRAIILHRIQYALKASLPNNQKVDTAKLLLRGAEEVSTNRRQADFLIENADLIARFAGPGQIQDLVFRKGISRWYGSSHAHCAAMLAADPLYEAEARSFLRQAGDWLYEWSKLPPEMRREEPIEHRDIAAMTIAILYLFGPKAAVSELARWNPKSLSFSVGQIIVSRLIDAGDIKSVFDLARLASKNTHLALAVIYELSIVGILPEFDFIRRTAKEVRCERLKTDLNFDESLLPLAIIALVESMMRAGLGKEDSLRVLEDHLPKIPNYPPSSRLGTKLDAREHILRAFCLRASLQGRNVNLIEIVSEKAREAIENNRGEHDEDVRKFREIFGALLPWYQLRSDILMGVVPKKQIHSRLEEAKRGISTSEWRWQISWELHDIPHKIGIIWFDILTQGGIADASSLDELEQWLVNQERVVPTPVWTQLARRSAHNDDAKISVLKFASNAKKIVDEQHISARDAADIYAGLARAVLPISRDDARTYFELGLKALDRLGDEARHRLDALCGLAKRAANTADPIPQVAYQLGRVAEVVHNYESHNFRWNTVAQSITGLCPSSGLAVISRWRDRNVGWIGETLPAVVEFLLEEEAISSQVAAALYVIGGTEGYWDLPLFLKTLLEKEPNRNRRLQILDLIVRDIDQTGSHTTKANDLVSVTKEFQIEHKRLVALAAFSVESQPTPIKQEQIPSYVRKIRKPQIDWSKIVAGFRFISPDEIDRAFRAFRKQESSFEWEEFYSKIRTAISFSDRVAHLEALVGVTELAISQILKALEESVTEWSESVSVTQKMPQVIDKLINRRGLELISSWHSIRRYLGTCQQLSGKPRSELLFQLLMSAADHIETVSVESLYILVEELSLDLSGEDAREALIFGLDRFESIVKIEDGDGPWREELAPPKEMSSTVAGFLWACLAAPETRFRWRAAHAVRRLCRLDQKEVIDALIQKIDDLNCRVFTGEGLVFYPMHARLYLLIALARAAKESPTLLKPHAAVFKLHVLKGLPHVLIKQFSADAALDIEAAYPGTYSAKVIRSFRAVNLTAFKRVEEVRRKSGLFSRSSEKGEKQSEPRFHFGIDMEPYWFSPLAEAFDLPTDEISKRAETWIVDRFGAGSVWKWKDDPRARRSLYRERETYHSHGTYPKTDSLSFYLSYHAMFCTAGELLQERPLVKVENDWPGDRWLSWLKRHTLTREDGCWLADRRDPPPLERSRWEVRDKEDHWRWSVQINDFDNALGVDHEMPEEVIVWGYWTISDGFREEEICVNSAFVNPEASASLLSALQNAAPNSFGVPLSGGNNEIKEPGYKLVGWIVAPDREYGLDRFDPLSGQIPYPSFRPSREIERIFRLRPDSEHRVWNVSGQKRSIVFSSEVWGDWKDEDEYGGRRYGRRIKANRAFLLKVLEHTQCDLIFKVTIERRHKRSGRSFLIEDGENAYVWPYFRIYLLKRDGSIHTIGSRRRIREASHKRT